MKEADKNFILATWLRTYRVDSPMTRGIPNTAFYKSHQKIIESIWDRKNSKTLTAALKEDEDVIVGYLCFEPGGIPTIHFCYIKFPFQGNGIANLLFSAAEINLEEPAEYTHYTKACDTLRIRFPKLQFNPYLNHKDLAA